MSASTAMISDYQHSPLVDLPPEIRLIIYEHLFASYREEPVSLRVGNVDPPLRRQTLPIIDPTKPKPPTHQRYNTAILRTCKLIRNEALPVLHNSASLCVDITLDRGDYASLYEELGTPFAECTFLRRMRVETIIVDVFSTVNTLRWLQVNIDVLNTLGGDRKGPLGLESLYFCLDDDEDDFDAAKEKAHVCAVTGVLMLALNRARGVKIWTVEKSYLGLAHDVKEEVERLARKLGGEIKGVLGLMEWYVQSEADVKSRSNHECLALM